MAARLPFAFLLTPMHPPAPLPAAAAAAAALVVAASATAATVAAAAPSLADSHHREFNKTCMYKHQRCFAVCMGCAGRYAVKVKVTKKANEDSLQEDFRAR